jgi:transcriptional regulator of acetoin/glycerol metabolism
VTWWEPGTAWPAGPHTIIVEHVDTLSAAEQKELLEQLGTMPRTVQVISTCSESLYAAVVRGAFLDALYYRLNMLRVGLPSTFSGY